MEPPGIENPFDGPDQAFIEEPDSHETGEQEIFCWMPMNHDRRCGGDCVAYEPRCEGDLLIDSCKLLNAVRGAANALSRISKALAVEDQKKDNERLRQQMESMPEPPEVR